MDLPDYMEIVAGKIREAHARGDKDEALRLAVLVRDTLNDKITEWTK